MNSGFLITDIGLAAATAATPTGPYIHITEFRVSSAVGYEPLRSMTTLPGTILHTGVPSSYVVIDEDTVEVLLQMDPTVGSFDFGTVGMYLASGELFAICVFDVLQQQIRAVGSQAGSTWKIRARLKLAQAATVVQVTLINSQSILELPNWASLAAPVNQLNDANIAIVHENNGQGQSVTVVRNSDLEWTLQDYSLLWSTTVPTDPGYLALTSTYLTHSEVSQLALEAATLASPRSDSRYVVKFPDGSIRRVTHVDGFSLYWHGSISPTTGELSVWEAGGGVPRINWADTLEYNAFVTEFNPYWSGAIGPRRSLASGSYGTHPAQNRGSNQVALPTLTRRTTLEDWSNLKAVVQLACGLHNVPAMDLGDITDFVYRPHAPTFPGLQSLRDQWDRLEAKLPLLAANKDVVNLTAFGPGTFEQTIFGDYVNNTYWVGKRYFDFVITLPDEATLQALLNSGWTLAFECEVSNVNNTAWAAAGLETFYLVVHPSSSEFWLSSSPLSVVSSTLGPQDCVVSAWTTVMSTSMGSWLVDAQVNGVGNTLQIRIGLDTSAISSTNYAGIDATFTWQVTSRKPSTLVLNNPELPHPTSIVMNIDDTLAFGF